MIKQISVDRLFPHPDNPRKDLGDLTELADSIKANGILQNLTVVPRDEDTYTVIIGHRRFAASKIAGLETVPCAVVEMDEKQQISTMLAENIQRADLTVYEQAQGFQMMLDLGCSMDDIVQRTGFSKSTVSRRLEIAKLDKTTLANVSKRQASLQDYDSLARITNIETRNQVLSAIGTHNFERELQRAFENEQYERDSEGWLKILSARGYTEIPYSESYSSKYDARFGYVHGTPSLEKLMEKVGDKETDEMFYAHGHGSIFHIRSLKTLDEDEQAAQNEQRKRIEEAQMRNEKLRNIAERAYKLRFDFVMNFPLGESKKKAGVVAKWYFLRDIVAMSLESMFNGWSNAQMLKNAFKAVFPFDTSEELVAFVDKHAEKALLLQVYAQWGDSAELKCWNYAGEYTESLKLKMIYRYLSELGYQMSDEEQQMLAGTLPELVKQNSDVLDTEHDEVEAGDDLNDADIDEILKGQLEKMGMN